MVVPSHSGVLSFIQGAGGTIGLRLKMFGTLAILRDSGAAPGAEIPRRPLAMLAVMATEGSAGITRDRLLALFWPDQDPEKARHSLDQAIYTVRRGLSPQLLVERTASIELNATLLPSDVADFKSALDRGELKEAVDAYSGPFLDGLHLTDAGAFERWAEERRGALNHAHVRALIELANAAGDAGDFALAVGYSRRAAGSEPLSSVVARALMTALYQAGDRSAALDAGRVHASLVRAELDADADPAVGAMMEAMRKGTFAAPPRPKPALATLGAVERRRGLRPGDVVGNLRAGLTTTATRVAARLAVRTSRLAIVVAAAALIVAVAAVVWAFERGHH